MPAPHAIKARPQGETVLRRGALWIGVCLRNGWRLHTPCGSRRHASNSFRRGPRTDRTENFLRRYVTVMGVDPDLVDAAAKIPSRSFRGLSRGEMERFGIETRGVHETPWFVYNGPAGEFILLKSVTYPTEETGDEYRTRTVGLACSSLHPNIRVTYHSGFTGKQGRTPPRIRAKIVTA